MSAVESNVTPFTRACGVAPLNAPCVGDSAPDAPCHTHTAWKSTRACLRAAQRLPPLCLCGQQALPHAAAAVPPSPTSSLLQPGSCGAPVPPAPLPPPPLVAQALCLLFPLPLCNTCLAEANPSYCAETGSSRQAISTLSPPPRAQLSMPLSLRLPSVLPQQIPAYNRYAHLPLPSSRKLLFLCCKQCACSPSAMCSS